MTMSGRQQSIRIDSASAGHPHGEGAFNGVAALQLLLERRVAVEAEMGLSTQTLVMDRDWLALQILHDRI